MTISRRSLLRTGLAAGAVAVARAPTARAQPAPVAPTATLPKPPAGESYTPVIVPDGHTLPFVRRGGAKVFHLIAEPLKHQIAPGLDIAAWGYNGTTPGPLLEAVVGDRVRRIDMGGMFTIIKVRSKLTAESAAGWYEHPRGTVAELASAADLARDGITP